MTGGKFLIGFGDFVLLTGSNGFIGSDVVETLFSHGLTRKFVA
jgi:UDP-glucose 4-epimerase